MQVYVIERPDGIVKIGKSNNPSKRIRALENQGGFRSNRAWISIPRALANTTELRAHSALQHNRKVGEWFAVDFDQAVATVLENGQSASNKPSPNDISDRINARLEEIDMLATRLADHCNVTRAAVTGWTSGNTKHIRPDHLLMIADVLGLELRWLISGKGPRLNSEI